MPLAPILPLANWQHSHLGPMKLCLRGTSPEPPDAGGLADVCGRSTWRLLPLYRLWFTNCRCFSPWSAAYHFDKRRGACELTAS